ncbi:MAG: DUF3429 domain-containing protein [Caulobacterales bacterium]|nr:DUF3429 domain-containing protein [Caulobacterales bacterium]
MTADAAPARAPIPVAALWLGGTGALPFILLAGASVLAGGADAERAAFALAAYGAVILSFLGGVHWGLAIAGHGAQGVAWPMSARLCVSVVPSLAGWGALLLAEPVRLPTLAGAFALWLVLDLAAARRTETPAWYPRLRWPLTITVVIALLTGAAG